MAFGRGEGGFVAFHQSPSLCVTLQKAYEFHLRVVA